MDVIEFKTYVSSSGILYHLYNFDDKVVVMLFGIPQMLCDITENYEELIERHERIIYGDTSGGNDETVAAEGEHGEV